MTTDIWLPDLKGIAGAKYLAIADALEGAVMRGVLRGGDRLPTQRALAGQLGIDLTTVTRAYDIAQQRGIIDARGRLGSFIVEPTETGFAALPQVDTAMNMPPAWPSGAIERAIADGTTALLRHGSGAAMQYQLPGGALQDRVAGAVLLSTICTTSIPEQVVLTAGGQNALHAILTSALARGDALACGTYVYSGLKALAARLGIRLVRLREISAKAVEDAVLREGVRALYLVPTNDNPTAQTLDLRQRKAISVVLARHDLQLIEDDAYGPLAIDPLPTMTSLVPERSWYISSLSKVVSPALRIAFVRAPTVTSALRLAADVHEVSIMPPPVNAALVSSWIRDGTYWRLIGEMRKEVAIRHALATNELVGLSYQMHAEGYHLWLPVPEGFCGREVADLLRPTGISAIASEKFAIDGAPDVALRISLGGLTEHDVIVRALRTLKGYLASSTRKDMIV